MKIELSLQRGDSDEEMAREYKIKLQQLNEQKTKEDQDKAAEMLKYMKFSKQQEPTFASLYLSIN